MDMIRMKGVVLPIETIVILTLAVIVFGVLLWFFTSSSNPVIDLTILKQRQSALCYSFHEKTDGCTSEGYKDMIAPEEGEELAKSLGSVCYKLRDDGGYSSCDAMDERFGISYPCAIECCKMFCGDVA
jgi:hypothetical protein